MRVDLPDMAATASFGAALAKAVCCCNPQILLLYGGLGLGKTTLVRFLVAALPGGETAEVASPSFTICNIYSTNPVVHHFDLYRLLPGGQDESLEESLSTAGVLTIIEWAEHLSEVEALPDGIACRLGMCGQQGRVAELHPLGPVGQHFLTCLRL